MDYALSHSPASTMLCLSYTAGVAHQSLDRAVSEATICGNEISAIDAKLRASSFDEERVNSRRTISYALKDEFT